MSQKLTPKLVRKLYPEQNSKEVEKLQLTKQGLTEVLQQPPDSLRKKIRNWLVAGQSITFSLYPVGRRHQHLAYSQAA